MSIRQHNGAYIRLPALFVVIASIPLAAFGWLGWRMLEQDRALENHRLRERLENAAIGVAREIERTLETWEEQLPAVAADAEIALPPDMVALVFDVNGVRTHRGVALPFYPQVPPQSEPESPVLAAAQTQEFREENLPVAARIYRRLAATESKSLRAAALTGLARCLTRQRRFDEALTVYEQLAELGEAAAAGAPAEIVARRQRLELFRTIGDRASQAREESALASALWSGRYRIDRATFDFYRESTTTPPPNDRARQLARAVVTFWPEWQQQPSGRTAWNGDGARAVAAVWRRTPSGTAAVVGSVDALASSFVRAGSQAQVALEDAARRRLWGAAIDAGPSFTKSIRETGLPWMVRVAAADAGAPQLLTARRRNLFISGFALMVLVMATSSYFVFRAVHRELSVARLQSDFVATVSHEFRTPLTAMRHLTEMLEEGGADSNRLPHYYRALGKETRRLHAMVESLLDFGRMEAGRRTYQMEDTSARDLARRVVDEFRERVSPAAQRIELEAPPMATSPHEDVVKADRDAIGLALSNLLDNAVKYSPDASTVRVSIQPQGASIRISVADEGPGMSLAEQRAIFRKFVRGTAATALHVTGTGIGLAIADQIVKAHGGRLEVHSEPGHGARFTILLPMQPLHT